MKEAEFAKEVAEGLREAGIPFQTEVSLGGITTDFVVPVSDGRILAIETKAWKKSPGFTNRAARLAGFLRKSSAADVAFVVVKDLERNRPAEGVLNPSALFEVLQEELNKAKSRPKKKSPHLKRVGSAVFAAMPFSDEYDDTFFVAMVPAARAVGAVCRRVDREEYVGNIVEKIEDMIKEASAVIADLSEARPNVLYEAGFARGLKRPTITVCSTPLDQLPFDVKQWNTIAYKKGKTHDLVPYLTKRLRSVLG